MDRRVLLGGGASPAHSQGNEGLKNMDGEGGPPPGAERNTGVTGWDRGRSSPLLSHMTTEAPLPNEAPAGTSRGATVVT